MHFHIDEQQNSQHTIEYRSPIRISMNNTGFSCARYCTVLLTCTCLVEAIEIPFVFAKQQQLFHFSNFKLGDSCLAKIPVFYLFMEFSRRFSGRLHWMWDILFFFCIFWTDYARNNENKSNFCLKFAAFFRIWRQRWLNQKM